MIKERQSIQQNTTIGNYSRSASKIRQFSGTDKFMITVETIKKLKKINLIPSQIIPTNLNTSQIIHPKPNLGSKYLLISNSNVAYYGQLNSKGIPETNYGIFIFADSSYYEGQIKNGKPQGNGIITNISNSYSYNGQWKKGLPQGFGKQTIQNNIYQGEFLNGKKNGKGKISYSDGSYYQGNFIENIIQGQGKYYHKNNYWEGKWKNGYLEGHGKQIITKYDIKNIQDIQLSKKKKQHSQYIGSFVKGQKSGKGNFKWNRNYQYEGQFEKGQLHGEGTFKFKGKIYGGVWSNGTQVKVSQMRGGKSSVILRGNINKDGSIVMTNSSGQHQGSQRSIKIQPNNIQITNNLTSSHVMPYNDLQVIPQSRNSYEGPDSSNKHIKKQQ